MERRYKPNLDKPEPKEKIIQNAIPIAIGIKMQSRKLSGSKLTHWKLTITNEFYCSNIILQYSFGCLIFGVGITTLNFEP
jgi:hypothetical protein